MYLLQLTSCWGNSSVQQAKRGLLATWCRHLSTSCGSLYHVNIGRASDSGCCFLTDNGNNSVFSSSLMACGEGLVALVATSV
ncbi:hypothetical protein RRG08_058419 [Elysia crispata]|uniref:Uncharacterized protein n=1 Tax=Elysia crispata TaxID=231223 RepID=A0AAE0XWJ8_9GAST|nr:hypothetical protein RRG08_058419 [Elysia crispata]